MKDSSTVRVFVVDDEEYLLSCYEDIFGEEGVQARYFSSGEEALDAARDRKPRVVLTDYGMPEMTGLELARRLHEIDPDIHVIVMTGLTQEHVELKQSVEETDTRLELMEKPLNVRNLLSRLAWILDPGGGPDRKN